jgi:hypothetical protein
MPVRINQEAEFVQIFFDWVVQRRGRLLRSFATFSALLPDVALPLEVNIHPALAAPRNGCARAFYIQPAY